MICTSLAARASRTSLACTDDRVGPESVSFAAALRSRLGEMVHCVPGFALDGQGPTTVGLGDTFVGGFLAALARKGPTTDDR